ncbi:hypothetical protein DFH06DRAFT_1349201 [Mycena polygramma]|nr:hypothetical protein DFH06DRAFT_1349201 [Mycena polygramma]
MTDTTRKKLRKKLREGRGDVQLNVLDQVDGIRRDFADTESLSGTAERTVERWGGQDEDALVQQVFSELNAKLQKFVFLVMPGGVAIWIVYIIARLLPTRPIGIPLSTVEGLSIVSTAANIAILGLVYMVPGVWARTRTTLAVVSLAVSVLSFSNLVWN